MNLILWIAAGILAAVSLGAGVNKLVVPRDKLLANPQMAWANDFSQQTIRLVAVAEVLGAVGVIAPWLLDIAKVLTPLAAIGLALLQVGALVTHAKRSEYQLIAVNSVLIALAVFVAVGRFADL
jgi:hypothetical protein